MLLKKLKPERACPVIFLNLFEDLENEENSYPKKYKEWCESVKDDYEYFEPMKDTEVKLPYYQKLLDFFLLSRLCHSGVELSARICRLHSYKLPNFQNLDLLHLAQML